MEHAGHKSRLESPGKSDVHPLRLNFVNGPRPSLNIKLGLYFERGLRWLGCHRNPGSAPGLLSIRQETNR